MTRHQAEGEIYRAFHKFPVTIVYNAPTDFGLFLCEATFTTEDYAMAAASRLPAHWTFGGFKPRQDSMVTICLYLDKYIVG